jgi:hypothetical protein
VHVCHRKMVLSFPSIRKEKVTYFKLNTILPSSRKIFICGMAVAKHSSCAHRRDWMIPRS